MNDANTFYLFDPAAIPQEPEPCIAFTIVTASPNKAHYKDFLKQIGGEKYYMPCWTWEEVENILPYFPKYPPMKVEDRFSRFGGILRYILSNTIKWDFELERAIAASSISDIEQSAGGPDALPSVSHKLMQYEVDADYECSRVRFASDYVATRVVEHLFKWKKEDVLRFLQFSKDESTLAILRGVFFERYVHTVLCGGGKFRVRRLLKQGEKTEEVITHTSYVISIW